MSTKAIEALKLAQNQIAASRAMCDDIDAQLWDVYESAILSLATPSPANGAVGEMPELPTFTWANENGALFDSAAMKAYARAAVLAEREQIAQMAENTNSHGIHIAELIRART